MGNHEFKALHFGFHFLEKFQFFFHFLELGLEFDGKCGWRCHRQYTGPAIGLNVVRHWGRASGGGSGGSRGRVSTWSLGA